jgi:hypothetical protein
MKDSYDCDCGVCGICNGLRRPFPPQKPGTHKWQHEDTGRCVDFKAGENPGKRWYRISDD